MPFTQKNNRGRPSKVYEEKRAATVNKSWDIVFDYLNDPNADEKEKREIAVKIAVKNIPQDITSGGQRIKTYAESQIEAIARRTIRNGGTPSP